MAHDSARPVPAAIANDIFDATGARVRTMPFTPERVRRGAGVSREGTTSRLKQGRPR